MKLKKEETIVQAPDMTCHMIRIYIHEQKLHYGMGCYMKMGYPMEKYEIKQEDIDKLRRKIDSEIYKETNIRVEPDDFNDIKVIL